MIFPPSLRPGDRVAVVAPSSPFPRDELLRGLAWLRGRYDVVAGADLFARSGYLAGSDARRAEALARAMRDPSVRAIFAARGGYGATRVTGALPWDALGRAPKWLVGFSDATALHLECARAGVASVHGPNVTGLGRAPPADRLAALRAVEGARALDWRLETLVPGPCEGRLFGGNLSLLAAVAAARGLAVPEGAIVVLEDVTERPYRVDRMLTSLAPELARAGAFVFGDFTDCAPGPDGVPVEDVLAGFARAMGKPAARGAPVGHGARNEAFVVGALATLRDGRLTCAPGA